MTSSATQPRLPGIPALILGQIRYQLRLFLATPGALVIGIGLPVILLVASQARHSGQAGLAVLAGYTIFGLTVTAFNTHGIRLIAAREAGILRRWRVSPMPPSCYFISVIVTSALFATFTGAATFMLGMLFYGAHVTAAGAALGIAALLLGALAWSSLATALTGIVPRTEVAQPVFILIYFPIVIVSGALGGGISHLPHWLATIASYLPAEPLVNAVTHAVQTGAAGPALPARDIILMVGWTVGGLLLAILLFRWDPHRPAQRRAARA
jgi:ABC-2 type transport system permease protein